MQKQVDKKTFIKEKLNNFILFIKKTFGENNILLAEFGQLIDFDKNGFEPFLNSLLQLVGLFKLPQSTDEIKKENINKVREYLYSKNLKATDEDITKMLRYFEMFTVVI